jgi:hypothetical protein
VYRRWGRVYHPRLTGMRIGWFLALALECAASSALAKPIELTQAQLDIGLTAVPLWVENRILEEKLKDREERLIELQRRSQWGSLLPISPGPGRGQEAPNLQIGASLGGANGGASLGGANGGASLGGANGGASLGGANGGASLGGANVGASSPAVSGAATSPRPAISRGR